MAATTLVADGQARRGRLLLDRGAQTTVYVACHDADRTEISVVLPGERLAPWCARHGVSEAIVGGFFTRPDGVPLGEVRTHGVGREHVPVEAPWHTIRACLHVEGGEGRIARRDRIACVPRGDLLQAGPLLVADGEVAYDPDCDNEGFCAAAHQSTPIRRSGGIRALRSAWPRGGCSRCGRSAREAGLTLTELARFMAALGCLDALNLDGGGSTALISSRRLQDFPRRDFEAPEPGGRPLATALAFHRV